MHPTPARLLVRPLLAALLVLASACEATRAIAPANALLTASTDRTQYQRVDGRVPVVVTLHNHGDHVIEVIGCPEPPALQLERRVDGHWESTASFNWICPAVYLSRAARLDPGAELVGQIHVDSPGEFRARVYIAPARADGPNPSVVSNAFVVR